MTASHASTTTDPAAHLHGGDPLGQDTPDVFERRLVSDAQSGCRDSFQILVARHQDATYRFCCQFLRCPEDAREACQDTFLRAYDALHRYQPRARFSTWLYRIALNLCRDRSRSRSARKQRLTDSLDKPDSTTPHHGTWSCPRLDPHQSLSLAEDLEKLRLGLEFLPAKLREPLVLSAIEGLGQSECAEILGCSPRAVEGRLYRARKALLAWWNSTA